MALTIVDSRTGVPVATVQAATPVAPQGALTALEARKYGAAAWGAPPLSLVVGDYLGIRGTGQNTSGVIQNMRVDLTITTPAGTPAVFQWVVVAVPAGGTVTTTVEAFALALAGSYTVKAELLAEVV